MNDFLAPLYIYLIPAGIILCLTVYQLLLKPLYFSPLRKIPGPPLGHLVYGQFTKMITAEPGSLHMKWADEYGPAVRFIGPFGVDHLLFLEPSAIERILVSNRENYPRTTLLQSMLGVFVGYGLLTTSGSVHKSMRKMVNPLFSLPNLIAQIDMFYPPLEGLIKLLHTKIIESPDPKEGMRIPVYDWVSRVSIDIICAAALDYYPDCVHRPDNELITAYRHIQRLQKNGANQLPLSVFMSVPGIPALLRTKFAVKFRKYLFFGPLGLFQTLASAMDSINTVTRPIMQAKLSQATGKDSEDSKDMLSLLARANLDDKTDSSKMTEQDLLEHARTLLNAGHEAISSGISWTLWLLAKNPECQRRLREEVLPVVQSNSRPDYRTLKGLRYLDAVVMESLRVLPPVPSTIRTAEQDDWIDGHYIPKGSLICIPIRAINMWTKVWGPDAKEFRPERWDNLPSTCDPRFSFLSFLVGPHACVGRTMAIMEMKVILATLISHFSFGPAYEGQTPHAGAIISMLPQDSMPLNVKLVGKLPVPV